MMLGEKIQQLRKRNGMSQEQLATQLTVSRQAISKWELSESVPDVENIIQLSKLFSVSTDYLLNDEYDEYIKPAAINDNNEKTTKRNKSRITAFCLIGVGLFGILVFWILSSVIPAQKWVPDGRGAPVPVEYESLSEDERQSVFDTEEVYFYTSIEVRGDLWAFLETYHFRTLFVLCCGLVIVGASLLIYSHNAVKAKNKQKKI